MQDIKISIITVCLNAEITIENCIESVLRQKFKNVEYIIIDGGSTDNTLQIINNYKHFFTHVSSGPDKGIYDAMNKGINLSTGQIIGMLNADDYFADDTVLSSVAEIFNNNPADIVYGNLDYINSTGKTVRKWRSGIYKAGMFNSGWMPPHPTFYCKRDLFDQFGLYSLDYGTAADYQLMLRFMHVNKTNAFYLPQVMVKMKNGGSSNKNIRNRVKGLLYDFKAMRHNDILFPIMTLIAKPLRKILQYF